MERNSCRSEVQILDDYKVYAVNCLTMLSEIQHICNGHFGPVRADKHQIKLSSAEECPIDSARYRAGHPRGKRKSTRSTRCLSDVIEPAKMEWTAAIVFQSKIDRTPRLHADYRQLMAVTMWDTNFILGMQESIACHGYTTIFSTRDGNRAYLHADVADENPYNTAFGQNRDFELFLNAFRPCSRSWDILARLWHYFILS